MSAQSPGAYALSALIHGAAVLLVLFFGYAASSVVQDTPRVFELVAGAGDNYAATAAPALGSPKGVRIAAAAPKPNPSPIRSAPPETALAAAPAKPAKPLDLVAELNRVEERRERRLEARYQKEQEAERKRIAQEETQRQQAAARVSHIDAEGIREGVIGGSTDNRTGGAGGKALTREEGSELDAYFALLTARITENAVPLEGVSDSLAARVEFFLAADGSISHVRILNSSGNHEFDRSAIEAVERTRSIGARPDGKSDTHTVQYRLHNGETP